MLTRFWKKMLIALAIALAFCFISCCTSQKTAERKIARIIECNPQLAKADSVTVHDTIYTEQIKFNSDTVITHDTLRIVRDGAKVTIVRKDTIKQEIPVYVEVECPPDTVYFEKTVPVQDRIEVNKEDKSWIWYFIITLALFVLLILFRRNI